MHTGRWMSHGSASVYLGTERHAPVIPNWFQPCQCCCCLCYPGEYLWLGTLISYNWAQVLEACNCLKLLSIYFDLCVDATGVVCHQLGLFGTDLHAVGCGGFVETLSKFASSSSSPARPSLSSEKLRLVIVLPPMMTVSSWSSKASLMILSRYICWRRWVRVDIPVGLQLLFGTSLLCCCSRGLHQWPCHRGFDDSDKVGADVSE